MTWQVRAAQAGDEAFLVEATLGNALDSEGIRLDAMTVGRGVRALLSDPVRGRLFVATDAAGRPVGSCYITTEWSDWHAMWYWWIQSVYVAPHARRQGVYQALHDAVRSAARAAGDVRTVRLYVERHNGPALAAYRRLGMTETPYVVFEQAPGQAGRSGGGPPGQG